MELGRLNALITADDRDFNRRMDAADRKGKSVAGRIRSTFASLKLNIPDIGGALTHATGNLLSNATSAALGALTTGMTDFIKTGIQYNKTVENATVAFESLGMSAQQTQQHLADLEQLALKTPFEYQDVIKASLSLNAFGFEARSRVADITALSDAAAIAAAGNGKFAESFQGIITAVGQMRAKGKLSAEEMQQLAERGIPAWDILAKKIGITKAELMKLSEQGKVNGEVASRLLIEGMGQYARGTGERLARTTQGKESNAADAYAKRAGEDVRVSGALKTYQDTLDQTIAGLDQKLGQSVSQGLIKGAAEGFSALTNIASDYLKGDLSTKELFKALPQTLVDTFNELLPIAKTGGASIWNGITEGFSGAFEGTKDLVTGKLKNWAAGQIQAIRDIWKTKSPSRVTMEIGANVVEGFDLGVTQAARGSVGVVSEWMQGALAAGQRGAARVRKPRAEENLQKLIEREPTFIAKLEKIAERLQTRPEWLLQVMAFETAGSFDPAKKNPTSSATGLIQFMADTARKLGTTVEALSKMSATEQLDYVEKYFKSFAGQLNSLGAVYNAVSGGFRKGGTDESMVYGPGRHANFVTANPGWDVNKDGTVTRGELAAVASAALSAEKALRALSGATVLTTQSMQQTVPALQAIKQAAPTPYLTGAAAQRYAFALKPATIGTTPLPDTQALTANVKLPASIEQFVFVTEQIGKGFEAVNKLAAPVPPALEGVGKGMDGVTTASAEATKGLLEVGGALGKTWAQMEKELNAAARFNLSDEARFGRLQDFQQRLGQGFDEVIFSLTEGGDRWKSALKNLANDFINSIVQEFMLAATGGKYGSIGGLLGGLVGGALSGLFSGGGALPIGKSIPVPAIGAFAEGGLAPRGLALVGEEGPELVNFQRPGTVIPARQTAALLRESAQPAVSQRNVTVVNHFSITAPGGNIPQRTQQQIATQAGIAAQNALRRNG